MGDTGLTANQAKCQLGQQEVTYMGYTRGRGELCPLVYKVQALQEYPTLMTKKRVQQFLRLAGYYRCFIPNFVMLATPLTDLTKNTQPWKVKCTTPQQPSTVNPRLSPSLTPPNSGVQD